MQSAGVMTYRFVYCLVQNELNSLVSHCDRFDQNSLAKIFFPITSPKVPPCARSLSNYRCELGVSGRLPDLKAPSPVNRALSTTLYCVPCFDDLMQMSCEVKSSKCWRALESNSVTQAGINSSSSIFLLEKIVFWHSRKPANVCSRFNLSCTQTSLSINGNCSV